MGVSEIVGKRIPKAYGAFKAMVSDAAYYRDEALGLASYHAKDMGKAAREGAQSVVNDAKNAAKAVKNGAQNLAADTKTTAAEHHENLSYHISEIKKGITEDIQANKYNAELKARKLYNDMRQPGVDYILKGKDGYGTGRAARLGIEVDAEGYVNRNVTNADIAKGLFLHEDGSFNKTRMALASVGAALGTAGVARVGINAVNGDY